MQTYFSEIYLNITHWVDAYGWIEIGQDEYSDSFVRLLNEGGLVWESNHTHDTVDEGLRALEVGLAEILKEWE